MASVPPPPRRAVAAAPPFAAAALPPAEAPTKVDVGGSGGGVPPASAPGGPLPRPPGAMTAAAVVATLPSRVSLSPDFTAELPRGGTEEEKKDEEEDPTAAGAKFPPAARAPSSVAAAPPAAGVNGAGVVPTASAPPPVVSAAVRAAAAASSRSKKSKGATGGEPSPRRTGRKRTSTVMVVDGHVIKKTNNYVVNGMTYVHGAFQADAPKPKKPKPAPSEPSAPPAPRQLAAHLRKRLAHNDAIKSKAAGEDDASRRDFMARRVDALAPFVEEKVLRSLVARKARLGPEPRGGAVLGSQPEGVITTLRDYQLTGLDWMAKMHARGVPFVLGDEMGLGKTLQTIALICYLKETRADFAGPSLVVCPLSVLYSWCDEVRKHAPSLKHFRFHSSDVKEREAQKDRLMRDVLEYDIVITTYEMAKSSYISALFRGTYFQLCVLDEGHVIKSLTTQVGEAVRKIHSRCRVILTGTPLQNNLVELYAILNYLYPQYFTTPEKFESAFNITLNQIDPDMLLKANKLLKIFMIRRLKDEVEKLMPKKLETKVLCPLSSSQIFWYKGFLMDEAESLIDLMDAEEGDKEASKGKGLMLRNLIMQLRKVCLHPYLFKFAEKNTEDTSIEELVASSGKLAVLDKLLRSLFKGGHRTCIFSQFTSMLDIMEDYCIARGWRYCRFDGSTLRAQRNHIINRFNAPGSDVFIFLMSTKSGGLGLNLQTADTCILYDSDWNPQPDLQAMARVHRIGQKKTVHVYRLISSGTVEERIVERAEKKLYLDQMVNRGTSNSEMDNAGGLTTSELLASLKFGSNAIFSSSNDLPTDKDICKVTDRSRSEESSDGLLKGGVTNNASSFDKDKELTDTQQFCGVDFRTLRDEKKRRMNGKTGNKFLDKLKQDWKEGQTGETLEELGKGKRNRKSRLLQVAGNGSGWGTSTVPVLAINDYDLAQGEPSAWGRETKKIAYVPKKKKTNDFIHQGFCQICGDGGTLIECPGCPVSVHSVCCGIDLKDFHRCTHHHCVHCDKNASAAGGLIYRCQSCPNAYCPDCLKQEPYRYLGIDIPRYEKLGFQGKPMYFYIHCSEQCEEVAKAEFGYQLDKSKPKCPSKMNVAFAFGKDAMDVNDMAKMFKQKAVGTWQGGESPKKSPPRIHGSRISPRKRSPTAKAAYAAAAAASAAVPQRVDIIDLSRSPQHGASDTITGYI